MLLHIPDPDAWDAYSSPPDNSMDSQDNHNDNMAEVDGIVKGKSRSRSLSQPLRST